MRCSLLTCVALSVCLFAGGRADEEKEEHGGHRRHEHHDPLSQEKEIDGQRNVHRDHEAVLGSKKLEEEADDMSPEQSKALLERLAHKHDLDGDGKISRDEFLTWVLQSFKNLDAEEAEERFKEEDTDGDGKLRWEEYCKHSHDAEACEEGYQHKPVKDEDLEDHKETMEMIDEDKRRFHGADLDKDGMLDANEYVAFYHPYDYEHMHEFEIERGIKDYDKDGDGVVNMKEYVGDIDDEESRISEETQFKDYDKDGNGVLERDELKAWLVPDNMDSASEEVDHLIKTADENGDGYLTFEEIRNKHEEFASSQATDYGSTLEKMRDEL